MERHQTHMLGLNQTLKHHRYAMQSSTYYSISLACNIHWGQYCGEAVHKKSWTILEAALWSACIVLRLAHFRWEWCPEIIRDSGGSTKGGDLHRIPKGWPLLSCLISHGFYSFCASQALKVEESISTIEKPSIWHFRTSRQLTALWRSGRNIKAVMHHICTWQNAWRITCLGGRIQENSMYGMMLSDIMTIRKLNHEAPLSNYTT